MRKVQPKGSLFISRHKGTVGDSPHSPGWLGNPVVIGKTCPMCQSVHNTAGSTAHCYREYLLKKLQSPQWRAAFLTTVSIQQLETGGLFCTGCGHNAPNCHGTIMREVAMSLHKETGQKSA